MAKKAPAGVKAPNVKFVGRDRDEYGKSVKAEPFERVNDGELTIELPSATEQRAGFYHEHAARLVRLFPGLYKFIV